MRTRGTQRTRWLNELGLRGMLKVFFCSFLVAVQAGAANQGRAETTAPPPCSAAQKKQAWVRSIDGFGLHSTPEGTKTGAGRLAYGDTVEIVDCTKQGMTRFKVRAGKLSGWVFEEHLSLQPVPSLADPMLKAGAALIEGLKKGHPLAPLVDPNGLLFVYSSDDRTDGSTKGQLKLKAGAEIDKPFKLQVVSDGKGWETPKKEQRRKVTTMTVLFTGWLKDWIADVHFPEFDFKRRTMSFADPASRSVIVRFKRQRDGSERLDRVEYRSEDPG